MSREVVLNGQRLEDAIRAANELASALCAGVTRDERDALWRHARALIELNLTFAAGEPVNPVHSVRVPLPYLTHGRHCTCSACAREDWTRITGPCGMHGPSCPAEYAPLTPEGRERVGLRLVDGGHA